MIEYFELFKPGDRIKIDVGSGHTAFITTEGDWLLNGEILLVLSSSRTRDNVQNDFVAFGTRTFFVGLRESTGEIRVWDVSASAFKRMSW